MAKEQSLTHINRALTKEEQRQATTIREGAQHDFPAKTAKEVPCPPGIPSRIQQARKQRGMTRYEVGKIANVPSTVVRAIEEGEDVPLSKLKTVVSALGLTIELVEQT